MKIRNIIDELEGDIEEVFDAELKDKMLSRIENLRDCIDDIESANNNIINESEIIKNIVY